MRPEMVISEARSRPSGETIGLAGRTRPQAARCRNRLARRFPLTSVCAMQLPSRQQRGGIDMVPKQWSKGHPSAPREGCIEADHQKVVPGVYRGRHLKSGEISTILDAWKPRPSHRSGRSPAPKPPNRPALKHRSGLPKTRSYDGISGRAPMKSRRCWNGSDATVWKT